VLKNVIFSELLHKLDVINRLIHVIVASVTKIKNKLIMKGLIIKVKSLIDQNQTTSSNFMMILNKFIEMFKSFFNLIDRCFKDFAKALLSCVGVGRKEDSSQIPYAQKQEGGTDSFIIEGNTNHQEESVGASRGDVNSKPQDNLMEQPEDKSIGFQDLTQQQTTTKQTSSELGISIS